MILRRIDPLSFAKVYGVVAAAVAFVFSLPAGCVMTMVGSLSDELGGTGFGSSLGLFMIILYPLLGLVAGFIGGFIMAWVYNLVAGRIGGVELEFEEDDLDNLR